MSNAYANRNGGRPVWDASPVPPLSSYDALRDPNMRHYFENRSVQAHLYKTGQIAAAARSHATQTFRTHHQIAPPAPSRL